jgi:uncharacterized RDD family membrane protein YckC
VSRTLAGAIDYAVATAIVLGAWVAVAALRFARRPRTFRWPEWHWGTFAWIFLVALVLSLTVGWATTGRTAGCQVLGLRVVTHRGDRLGVVRALVRAIFVAVFPFGLFWAAVSSRNRSVQDVVLQTSVVHDWTRRVPDAEHGTHG